MKRSFLLALLLAFSALSTVAQLSIGGTRPVYDGRTKTYLLTLPQSVFGQAYSAPVTIDNNVSVVTIDGKTVTDAVEFPVIKGDTSYVFTFKKNNAVTRSSIHFTFLPILSISGTFGNEYVVAPVQITMPDGNGVQDYQARIKRAGASTNSQWVHKHSYHVKFVDDKGEKMDVSFYGLRNDNHWRLDAGTRDMIRFRNYAANGLWADFGTRSYYADEQPNARSYIRGFHVEVFMNGNYHGFYNFSEFLDRKQMKLKKYTLTDDPDGGEDLMPQLHGLMWKATTDNNQTLFVACNDSIDNTKDEWGGYELEYPELDEVCPTDYSILYNAVDFVSKSVTNDFVTHVGEFFDLPVLADYILFLHVVFGIDNACNNMVLGCYDSARDKKLTFAVWDLDATVGQHFADMDGYYHADEIQPERELDDVPYEMSQYSHNKLFKRLMAMPTFKRRVVNRYWQLRQTVLDPDNLVARYEAIYRRLEACGALDRETVRWSDTGDISHRMLTFDEEFDYLCDWLRRRIAYLDCNTFACQRGDVNEDGRIDVMDVTLLIDYILGGGTDINMINADLTIDDVLDVTDVVALVAMVLNNS